MNPQPPLPPDDPEALLRSGLRDTTPEFEHRWIDLKRRLRTRPIPRRSYAPGWWWGLVSAGITFAVILFVLRPQYPPQRPLAPAQLAAFEALFALDADLRGALPLADNEAVEDLLSIPLPSSDQS